MIDAIGSATDTRFQDAFNRDSFLFDHGLHNHPLYDIESLVGLAQRLGPHSAYWSTRPAAIADGWEDSRAREQSLEEAVATIEHSNTLVVLKDIERDPVFGPVFGAVVSDLAARTGRAHQADLVHGRATLLISSPRRVTGYHIDAEANFLLQLRGDKTVHVFDGADRDIVTDAELEAFYAGDLNGARYKEDDQGKARTIGLPPWDRCPRAGGVAALGEERQLGLRIDQHQLRPAVQCAARAGVSREPPYPPAGPVSGRAGDQRVARHRPRSRSSPGWTGCGRTITPEPVGGLT